MKHNGKENKPDIREVENLILQAESLEKSNPQKQYSLLKEAYAKCVAHWENLSSHGNKPWLDLSLRVHDEYFRIQDEIGIPLEEEEEDNIDLALACAEMLGKRPGELSSDEIERYYKQLIVKMGCDDEDSSDLMSEEMVDEMETADEEESPAQKFFGLKNHILNLIKESEQHCKISSIQLKKSQTTLEQKSRNLPATAKICENMYR